MIDSNVLTNAINALNALRDAMAQTDINNDAKNENSGLSEFSSVLTEATEKLENLQISDNSTELETDEDNSNANKTEMAIEKNLLVATAEEAKVGKPTLAEFMGATGLEVPDAVRMHSTGSNTDLRNWTAIMSNGNVLEDTRTATRQLYESDLNYQMGASWESQTSSFNEAKAAHNTSSFNIVNQNSRFADLKVDGKTSTFITDKNGLIITGAGSTPDQIKHTAWLYGIDL